MVKILVSLLLLVSLVRVCGPATDFLYEGDFYSSSLQEEDSKEKEQGSKEKVEQEQLFTQPGDIIAACSCRLITRSFYSHQFISAAHDEPSCPPPDTSRS